MRTILIALSLLLITYSAVFAAPFQNGSFEINGGAQAVLSTGDTSMTGWVVTGDSIDLLQTPPTGWQPSDGNFSLDLDGNDPGGVQQTFDTINGVHYTVTFDMAGNYAGGSSIKTMRVQASGTPYQDFTFDSSVSSQNNMGWTTHTYSFTANGPSTTLSFTSLSISGPWGPRIG